MQGHDCKIYCIPVFREIKMRFYNMAIFVIGLATFVIISET